MNTSPLPLDIFPEQERGAERPARRVPELDGLRGLAILLVLICHYIGASGTDALPPLLRRLARATSLGWIGVDLFFVLSGFLIGRILLESTASARYFKTFYMRRVYRILPLYYAWVVGYVLLLLILRLVTSPGLVRASDISLLPKYTFFLQNFFYNKQHLEWVWFGATWSLAVEEQFYLCVPFVVYILSRRALVGALVALIVGAPILRLLLFMFARNPIPQLVDFLTICRADSLGLGVLIAVAWRDPRVHAYLSSRPEVVRRAMAAILLVAAAFCYPLLRPRNWLTVGFGYSVLATLFAGLILFVLLNGKHWFSAVTRISALRLLGTISYCVYIIHYPVLYWHHRLLLGQTPRIDSVQSAVVTMLALVVTLTLAALSWKWLEKPMIRRGHQYYY